MKSRAPQGTFSWPDGPIHLDNIAAIIPATYQKFTIPGRLPGYNELKDGHWFVRQKKKQAAMDVVIWRAKAARIKPVKGQCYIRIVCHEPNLRRDGDNVESGAKKIILDALQQARILAGDGRKYISKTDIEIQLDRQSPRVEVEIVG